MSVTRESTKLSPVPFRPDAAMVEALALLSERTQLPKADIIRRAVAFALPKFLSGEVPIVSATPQPETTAA